MTGRQDGRPGQNFPPGADFSPGPAFPPRPGLSSSALKGLALGSMTIDHAAAVLLLYGLFVRVPVTAGLRTFYLVCRGVGRLAFPIYCFLLAEGLAYTASRRAYAGRLALFALLSELPFDLAFGPTLYDPAHQNVFFTLLLGLLGAWAAGWGRQAAGRFAGWRRWAAAAAGWAAALCCVLAADALRTDYGGFGVLLILTLSLLREDRPGQLLAGAAVLALMCWWENNWLELWALPAFLLLALYNGQKGRGWPQYAFYLYYPLHLLTLCALRWALPG